MDEQEASRIAEAAVEAVGGTRQVYRNPRYAFSLEPSRTVEIEGQPKPAMIAEWISQIFV